MPSPSAERPSTIRAITEIEQNVWERGGVRRAARYLGDALGSVRSGLSELTVEAGALSNPPHTHSTEDELFVVLEGDGTLELMNAVAEVVERYPVRAGHVVSRPARDRLSHAFRAGAGGMRLLGYAKHDDADMCFYPRSQKVGIGNLGVFLRVESLDYWDGEE